VNLKTFLAAVRMYWKTFVVVTVTVLALGVTWLLLTPIRYVSTTQLLVSIRGSTTAAAYQNDGVVLGRVNSYVALLTSDVVSQRVVDDLRLNMTARELAAKVSATEVPPKTSIIDVAVTDESSEQAQRIADTLGREFISYTNALETPTGEDGQKVQTSVVTAASEPHSRLAQYVALGVLVALAALLLGAVAVWIRSMTDRVVRTANRAAAAAGVPVLGCVTDKAAVSAEDLEGYRRLRTRLRSTTGTGGGQVVEMASVDGDVNASRVAFNLGRAIELADGRTIVVDADLEVSPARSGTADEKAPGLIRSDGEGWREPTRTEDGFPDTLSMSAWAAEPDRVVTKAASGLFEKLRGEYENVIIAAAPVHSTPAASVLSDYVDGVLFLVSTGTTKWTDLTQAAECLKATGAPVTGVVLVSKRDDSGGIPRSDEGLRRPSQSKRP
jgi:capsular polysaccharide biosynthesis protein